MKGQISSNKNNNFLKKHVLNMVGEAAAIHVKKHNSAVPYMVKTNAEACRILAEIRICRIKPTFPGCLSFLPLLYQLG